MRYKTPVENWLPREQAPAFDPNRYAPALLARAVGAWRQFSADERDSVIVATLVTTDLARLGAPPAILGMAARVIEDQARHVEVCTRVLEALGSDTSSTPAGGTRVALGDDDDDEDIEARLARTLIARFAVGQSLSAACFATARATAREPLIAWAYTELLRDEARHGAFGARAGEWVIRHWSAEQRQRLWADCLREMQSFERRVGGPVVDAPKVTIRRNTAAAALGLLSPEASCGAVIASIPRWVLPHLARLGVVPPSPEVPTLLQ
ncbi:MAG TPA: ferritin-like domain-containing protein [Polyangia bacterium]|jgi:hypothetical protein|nr:ferritin-like domain-containing protein [Polyangia bacterium]